MDREVTTNPDPNSTPDRSIIVGKVIGGLGCLGLLAGVVMIVTFSISESAPADAPTMAAILQGVALVAAFVLLMRARSWQRIGALTAITIGVLALLFGLCLAAV